MEALDCDKGLLKSGNQVAARDSVQFVELRKFIRGGQVQVLPEQSWIASWQS